MSKRLLRTLGPEQLKGRRVLVRADLNVPLAGGVVTDDTRIRASLPTLEHLTSHGSAVILMSHLGRPKGGVDPTFSLAPVADRLQELLEVPVRFVPDTVGDAADAAVAGLRDGEVLLLENTRFLPGETANEEALARRLASYGSVYVNDAFGTAHRAHASTAGIAEAVKENGGVAVAGFLLERELAFLGDALARPDRPYLAIMGGAKISGKIDVVEALLPQVDRLLIGGAMANTFFLALGLEVGGSLVEDDRVEMARALMDRAGERLVLPVDCRVSERISGDATSRAVSRAEVAPTDIIGDIGPETESLYRELIQEARTVLWNGPMGVFELEPFASGTLAVARAVADRTDQGAVSVVGGGDSAAAAEAAGVSGRLTHISTGGGASLEFLSGAELPGVAVLSDEEG
ncbi:MAG: phosphoglycerate kinase [Gemmatimonadales bacterium]|nr:MAG: phosphoglycerate kinase [Gemmatimonadales bacterium]